MDKKDAVNTVVDFMTYAVHKLDNAERFEKLREDVSKKIDALSVAEDDLKRYDIAFMLIDTELTDRNYDESEQMFMHLVVLAGNKFGKPGVWATKEFMREKIAEANELEFAEWRILEEFLCESPFSEAEKNKYKGVTYILNSYAPNVVQEKTKKLLDLDLKNIRVEIKNNLIEIENIEK